MDIEGLYLKHNKQITTYCFSMLNDWQDAEDISQEVFTRIIEKPPVTVNRNWLFISAKFKCLDLQKKNRRIVYFDTLPDMEVNSVWHQRHKMPQREVRRKPRPPTGLTPTNYQQRTAAIIAGICRKLTKQFA
ncbi:MAG: hypothetical protein IPL32_20005 [Chloracidobacterium sp.]|nr:hypothetical protein [Chloracidobacterium sp.]